MKSQTYVLTAVLVASSWIQQAISFQPQLPSTIGKTSQKSALFVGTTPKSGQGFSKAATNIETIQHHAEEKGKRIESAISKDDLSTMRADQVKDLLLDLLPRMTGTTEEFALVQSYVNVLEDKFVSPQTLDFLNLAMAGEWQFLFTTNQLGRPSPSLRLTELVQKLNVNGLQGKIVNQASWDLSEEVMGSFDVHGTFSSSISYNINQGARMTINEDHDLAIKLGTGSRVPSDPQGLVGLIHRAMPTEMFDSSNLAMDTTFLDTDLRIVRFTGSRHEGVRNIFMRKGAFEINPDL